MILVAYCSVSRKHVAQGLFSTNTAPLNMCRENMKPQLSLQGLQCHSTSYMDESAVDAATSQHTLGSEIYTLNVLVHTTVVICAQIPGMAQRQSLSPRRWISKYSKWPGVLFLGPWPDSASNSWSVPFLETLLGIFQPLGFQSASKGNYVIMCDIYIYIIIIYIY